MKIFKSLLFISTVIIITSCSTDDSIFTNNDSGVVDQPCDIVPSIWTNGDGSISNPYQIESIENLYYLAEQVNDTASTVINNYNFKYFKLINDIDLNCKPWIPIGGLKDDYIFEGDFDGNNKTISNVTIDRPDELYVGFFGFLGYNSSLKNLTINGNITGDKSVGGLAGFSYAEQIQNSCFNGAITGNDWVGGILGFSRYGTMENCCFDGTIKGNDEVGGIVGHSIDNSLNNCSSNLTSLEGNDEVGGITGSSAADEIISSSVSGNIIANKFVGGISGRSTGVTTIEIANFEGSLLGLGSVGGICGDLTGSTISESSNKGTVSASGSQIGGIVGMSYGGRIEQSFNTGNVNGSKRCGGIVGRSDASGTQWSYVENCYNTGDISSTDNELAAGIVGGSGTTSIKYCYNTGSVPNTGTGNSENDNIVVYDFDGFSSNIIVEHCYFLDGIDQFSHVGFERTAVEMKSSAFINELNTGANNSWKMDVTPNVNNEFPILNWQ